MTNITRTGPAYWFDIIHNLTILAANVLTVADGYTSTAQRGTIPVITRKKRQYNLLHLILFADKSQYHPSDLLAISQRLMRLAFVYLLFLPSVGLFLE